MHYVAKHRAGPQIEIKPGAIFGDLKILRQIKWKTSDRRMWEAECLCGKVCKVDRSMLVGGRIACMPCEKKYARSSGRQSRSHNLAKKYEQAIRFRWQEFVDRCRKLGCDLDTNYQIFRAELMNDPDFLSGFDEAAEAIPVMVHHEARDYAVLYSEK